MQRLFRLLLVGLSIVLFSGVAYAQTATPPATTTKTSVNAVTDLKFPIKDLGNCTDYKSCLTFCDDPVNNASCVDFAKKSGFYKEDPTVAPTDKFLTQAKTALGCDSETGCLDFCSKQENFDKCDKFAKSEKLVGGYVDSADKPVYLDKAKQVLGCDSASSCSTLCSDSANSQKCSDFASQVGLLGGEVKQGPGGCSSDGTCKSFCSDPKNFDSCKSFTPADAGTFKGPGGCDTKENCRSHCEQNPSECRSYAPGSNGVYVPATCPAGQFFGPGGACTSQEKTKEAASCSQGGKFWSGTGCQDTPPAGISPNVGGAFFQPRPEMGNCATPGSCYDFCKENPTKCAGFDTKSERPKDGYIPTLYYTPGTEVKFTAKADMGGCDSPGGCYDFCKSNPGKCQGFDATSPRPSSTYTPGTYFTPPSDATYFTPPATSFYVTPIYYTPPAGSKYTTPSYYTPGIYSTPNYYTPPVGTNYSTPTYYTPGTYYATPTGEYPTPHYSTPTYFTPPAGSNYTTPTYYSPAQYVTPNYYTPTDGKYTTPAAYSTPPAYTTPTYATPTSGEKYTTPVYYSPPSGSNYTTPNYPSPANYTTPTYSTPPAGSTYTTPTYYSPGNYVTPPSYSTPSTSYSTPASAYNTPPPTYSTPSYSTPSYTTPSYGTPSYETPTYNTPSYNSPPAYTSPPPGEVHGAATSRSLLEIILSKLTGK